MHVRRKSSALAVGLFAVEVYGPRRGYDKNPLHLGLEAAGHPRLVLLGARRKAILLPKTSMSRSIKAKDRP